MTKQIAGLVFTERICDDGHDCGVTVIYTLHPKFRASVEFRSSYEIDSTSDLAQAANYCHGIVEYDGVSRVYFGEANDNGGIHMSDAKAFHILALTLTTIIARCGELMRDRDAVDPDNVAIIDYGDTFKSYGA